MSKKDFKNMDNPALSFITQVEQHTPNTQVTLNTQGVQDTPKGQKQAKRVQKLPRINMAFSEENLEYLQLASRIEGVSITAYVNQLVLVDKLGHADMLELAKKVLK